MTEIRMPFTAFDDYIRAHLMLAELDHDAERLALIERCVMTARRDDDAVLMNPALLRDYTRAALCNFLMSATDDLS